MATAPYLLSQDVVEVRVQVYVVLLQIPVQLVCAQNLGDAHKLKQSTPSKSLSTELTVRPRGLWDRELQLPRH